MYFIHAGALAKVETNIFFGSGQSESIHLDDLRCSGMEQDLLECSHAPIGDSDCGHAEDVGVICEASEGMMAPSKFLPIP